MGLLDRLPAWIRHLVIVFGATFVTVVAKAVAASNGVTNVAWSTVWWAAVDGAAAAVAAVVLLAVTPVTRQYGVGQR
jgi:membrane protein YdbS with pleckstrin-like domain